MSMLTTASTMLAAACSVRRAPAGLTEPAPCFAEGSLGDDAPSVQWVLRNDPEERSALDAWCWGVGPAVFTTHPLSQHRANVDSVAIVVWNTHIGSGDLAGLIRDLRSGRLTGAPVEHFVMLLQEIHRVGQNVPATIPAWVPVARGSSDRLSEGIAQLALEQNLSLLYAPSMRSARAQEHPPEDRGNAILSTLPLHSPAALELPWERQRRVAVVASVKSQTTDGMPWSIRFVSAHLDNRTRLAQVQRSFGAGRLRQARALADQLADETPTVFGADLNTWLGGENAGEARVLREVFPGPSELPNTPTVPLPGPLPDMQLDYLLFRLPDGWNAHYDVLDHTYGSDHRPLVGWVHPSTGTIRNR